MVIYDFLSIIGLLELEAGLSASVLKPGVKRPQPRGSISKNVIKPTVNKAVELMQKYKVKQEKCSLKFYRHMNYQLWFHRP